MRTLHVVIVALAVVAASALFSRPGAEMRSINSSISSAGKDAAWATVNGSVWYCTTIQNKCEQMGFIE